MPTNFDGAAGRRFTYDYIVFSYHDTREVLQKDAELRLTGLASDRRAKLDLWLDGVDKELETIAEASAANESLLAVIEKVSGWD